MEVEEEFINLNYDTKSFVIINPEISRKILVPGDKALILLSTDPVKQNTYLAVALMEKRPYKKVAIDYAAKKDEPIDVSKNFYVNSTVDKDLVMETPKVSIVDSITKELMLIPVRGKKCKHLQCFDLMNYLKINMNVHGNVKWKCPICKGLVTINDIFLDKFLSKTIVSLSCLLFKLNRGTFHLGLDLIFK
jgi:hypothetical protein